MENSKTFQIVPEPIEIQVFNCGKKVEIKGLGLHLLVSLEEKYPLLKIREGLRRLIESGRLKLAPTHLEPVLRHKELFK